MASISPSSHPSASGHGEPTWDIALLYPRQGTWSQDEYLSLTDDTNWLIEYTAGRIEVLPMPTIEHQLILKFLLRSLDKFVEPQSLGIVLFAPTRVYIEPDRYREPDIVFNFMENHTKSGRRFYQNADLVMEIISDENDGRERDTVQKRKDYAEGGIPEYWIVDPVAKQITVLALHGKEYAEHGIYSEGETATSKLLEGFTVDVTAVFQAAKA